MFPNDFAPADRGEDNAMANDVIFKKKAFGGYDKDSVLSYVNSLLNDKTRLEKLTEEQTRKAASLTARVRELEERTGEADRLTEALTAREGELAALQARLDEAEAALREKEAELAELRNNPDAGEIEALRAENEALHKECEHNRDLERQVGAAMLDARVRSDELIAEAKQRAEEATRSVYDSIGDTALKIDDLSEGIAEIARSFTKSVEEVELRIKVLTGNMSKTAQALLTAGSADGHTESTVTEPTVESAGVQYETEPERVDFTPYGESDV